MELPPLLAALRHNIVGAILIATQVAVTLAVLCNGLFIIQNRLSHSQRPSGLDESNLFAVDNQWVGSPTDLAARVQTDLAVLRTVPGVVDAYSTNAYPLTDAGWAHLLSLNPDELQKSSKVALYFGDDRAVSTLGLKLIAGRNFTPVEITDREGTAPAHPASLIITRTLAERLFPGGNAVGQSVYVEGARQPSTIVGIVQSLQIPWTGTTYARINQNSVLEPFRYVAQETYYLVRTRPGQLAAAMQATPRKLLEVTRARVLKQVQAIADARAQVYRDDRGLAVILATVCAALLSITAFGIVGLTSYWISLRRRQIGIRRALGATRTAILRYFHTENLLISLVGVAAGIVLATAVNLWMMTRFATDRLQWSYLVVGAALMLLIGQLGTLWPALRAAYIPPTLAARSI